MNATALMVVVMGAALLAMLSICSRWLKYCARTQSSSAPARAAPTPRVEHVLVAVIASDGRPRPPRPQGAANTKVPPPPPYSFQTSGAGWEEPPPPYDSVAERQPQQLLQRRET